MQTTHWISAIALLAAFLFPQWALAVAPAPAPAKSMPSLLADPVSSVSQLEAESRVQEAQLAMVKEYHATLLDTVYWALGTLATVSALLAGFGWFANFRLYETDKARLKEDFARMISESSLITESKLATTEADLIQKIDARLDAHLQRASWEIQAIRSDLSALARKQVDDKTEVNQKLGQMLTKLDGAIRDVRIVESSMRLVEEYVWDLKGIPTNKLITQGQTLKAAIAGGETYYVTAALNRMRDTLKDVIIAKKLSMNKTMVDILQEAVAKAAKSQPIPANEVAELLKSVQLGSDG